MSSLPVYTQQEVASHNTADSLWLIIEGKVYDVTEFLENVSLLAIARFVSITAVLFRIYSTQEGEMFC